MAEWFGAFTDLRVDIEELIDAGDRVVAVLRLHGRVRDSGEEVEMAETHVITIHNGKATSLPRVQERRRKPSQAVGLQG